MHRQAGLLALGSAGEGQPSHRGCCNSPAVAGLRLNFLRPRLQRRDRPGFTPGSGLPGGLWWNDIIYSYILSTKREPTN